MSEYEETPTPPAWKSFMVGMMLLTIVLSPLCGMAFYFSPLASKLNWYPGATLPLGFAVGILISIVLSAVFAARASR
jgi:hypothetical protein